MAVDATQQVVFTMLDNNGKTGTTAIHIVTSTSDDPLGRTAVTDIGTAILGISDAKIVGRLSLTREKFGTLPVASVYGARDKLVVELKDSIGRFSRIKFPSPLAITSGSADLFLANGREFVDSSNPEWIALVAAIQTHAVDSAGGSFTVVRGYRDASRRLRPGSKKFV